MNFVAVFFQINEQMDEMCYHSLKSNLITEQLNKLELGYISFLQLLQKYATKYIEQSRLINPSSKSEPELFNFYRRLNV